MWKRFRYLEDAGAFAVECELIPANVMAEIRKRTGMATISLGSGTHADVLFLFTSDICGDGEHIPRHARVYADLNRLRAQMNDERVRALSAFRADVEVGSFPNESEIVLADEVELARFVEAIG